MPRPNVTPLETGTISIVVGDADLASTLDMNGQAPVPPVFATSRMIALMEFAASQCIEPLLAEGELSVGVAVNVRHTAATPTGVAVTATARYLDGGQASTASRWPRPTRQARSGAGLTSGSSSTRAG
jgi:predicted thioesterase